MRIRCCRICLFSCFRAHKRDGQDMYTRCTQDRVKSVITRRSAARSVGVGVGVEVGTYKSKITVENHVAWMLADVSNIRPCARIHIGRIETQHGGICRDRGNVPRNIIEHHIPPCLQVNFPLVARIRHLSRERTLRVSGILQRYNAHTGMIMVPLFSLV